MIENAKRLGGMHFTDGEVDKDVLAGEAANSTDGEM